MKKTFLASAALLLAIAAKAQFVSLNNDEIGKLKKLIATDKSAKGSYAEWQQTAQSALGEAPNPIDTIHTEGRLQGDPQKVATQQSLRDMRKMYALAIVYRVEGGKKYLDKAVDFLKAWSEKNKPNGDPIDDTNLDAAVETFDLLKDDINPKDKTVIVNWLAATAQREIDRFNPKKATGYNNWHSHRLKEVGEIGFAIGDKKYQDWAIEGLKTQLGKNLLPDGRSIDFNLRDAMHYHTYDLEPLLKLSIILKRATGVDYYNYVSPEQTSIKKSVEWMLPYMTGAQTHPEFVNSTVAFDKKRAENGEKGYKAGTLFEPKNGLGVFYLAEYFFPDAINVIQKVSANNQNFANWQLVLNRVRR